MFEILHLRRQRGRRGHVVFYVALSAQSWPYSTVVESVISLPTRYSHRRCCSRQQLFGNEAFSCGGDEELTWCQAPNKAYLDSSVKLSAWQERHHLTHRSLNCDTNAKGNGA